MIARFQEYEERLTQEVWGRQCLECDSIMKPKFHLYPMKDEEVAILTCQSCDFTIVVVEVEKLSTENTIEQELVQNENTIVATRKTLY